MLENARPDGRVNRFARKGGCEKGGKGCRFDDNRKIRLVINCVSPTTRGGFVALVNQLSRSGNIEVSAQIILLSVGANRR